MGGDVQLALSVVMWCLVYVFWGGGLDWWQPRQAMRCDAMAAAPGDAMQCIFGQGRQAVALRM